jgi:general secretion pathway protein L
MARTINKSGLLNMDMGQVFSTWWHWWRKELEELLPSSMRRWLQRTNRLMILRIQGNTLQLAMALEPGHILGEIPLGDSSDAHAVQQDMRRLDLDATTVALQLPAGMVLKRAVTLPASARNNLGTILGYQMASLTPWSQDQVHFGWHVIASSGPLLHLTLYVCPRSRVEPILQPLRRLGLEVHDLAADHASDRS